MQELLEWMEYIEDKRQQRKVRYTLKDILVIVLFATLANADDWVEIALFAEDYQDYLQKYIELKNRPPSHDTTRRVMGMISPEILQQLYTKWQERLNRNDGELLKKIICIDGKTMCANKRKEEKPSHIVSAWSKEDGFCLGQKALEEKSNEITAIPELLEKIQIKGQVITIDAMGTQKGIAEKIKKKRADYVLALKGNQGTMYEDAKEYFKEKKVFERNPRKGCYKRRSRKSPQPDRNKGVLSDRRYRVDGAKERMEGFEKHCYGEENPKERWNRERGVSLFYQQSAGRY